MRFYPPKELFLALGPSIYCCRRPRRSSARPAGPRYACRAWQRLRPRLLARTLRPSPLRFLAATKSCLGPSRGRARLLRSKRPILGCGARPQVGGSLQRWSALKLQLGLRLGPGPSLRPFRQTHQPRGRGAVAAQPGHAARGLDHLRTWLAIQTHFVPTAA